MDSEDTSPLNVANSFYDTSVVEEAQIEAQLLAQREAQAQFEAHQKAQLNIIVDTQLVGSPSKTPSPQVGKGVVTRSPVTNSFEHQSLGSISKPRTKKMAVTIKLEDAFKLIPICTGIDDIYQFINAYDMAVSLVDTNSAPILVKYIATQLTGRALEMIKYKNVTKWQYIKNYLTDAFEVTTNASSLQLQLNSIRMNHNEDVNDYCHRVEKLYYQLCTVSTLNKEATEARIIHETLREQTLTIKD
ncbi:unnamed protein product [Macrosiphum euphorbiae]|uniref:Retrotransposon gag domain-containing protein n=1 Tax=Macrosiphum euphorbiae TaxID=13131 RepID=A0AAV0YAQ2_9HEMI|nr:unnamed protein product [Macrosiphum euphorbiae]